VGFSFFFKFSNLRHKSYLLDTCSDFDNSPIIEFTFAIFMSSNSSLQALRINGPASILGNCDFQNLETNFFIFGIYFT
jgi:hypothetical protein